MTERYDTIVIGAGHNGLTCAAYLARAGRSVAVLEAADQLGGAAVTREFAPGFHVSACAHVLYGLDQSVADELDLKTHGLEYAARDLATVALGADGEHLRMHGDDINSGVVSHADADALKAFRKRYGRFARVLAELYQRRPPRLAPGDNGELMAAAKMGWAIRRLGRDEMREFLRVAAINVYDVLEEAFDSELLKGALAMDAILGTHLGPRSNNSVVNLLHRYAGQGGACDLPRGGMGAVGKAFARAAQAAGATLRTGAVVERILIDDTRASGVLLAGGETIHAAQVVSSADPHSTFFNLVGADRLETGFVRRIQHLRMHGNAAKVHLALDGIPKFTDLSADDMRQRLLLADTTAQIERAFDCAKYGRFSERPVAEIVIPSLSDPTVAPDGKHVLSAVVQYAPYGLRGGWDDWRGAFMETVLARLEEWAPDIRAQIVASELLTPTDLERDFRLHGGHWHHVELAFDQFLMLRPVPGAAQYRSPVDGLFLCGAGCHPGGGIMGTAGRNAAREMQAQQEAA